MYRGVFDFGSGTTKFALVMKQPGASFWEPVFGSELECFIGYSVKRSKTNSIPPEMVDKLSACVKQHLNTLSAYQHHQHAQGNRINLQGVAGFATAVYRECANGQSVLEQVSARHNGLPITIISQRDEARAGAETGHQCLARFCAAHGTPTPSTLLTWDSGGGSFQLTYTRSGGQVVSKVFEGKWGNSKTAHYYQTTVMKRGDDPTWKTMNPVLKDSFNRDLIDHLKADIGRNSTAEEREWLRRVVVDEHTPVIAIGGGTSCFRIAEQAVGRSSKITPHDLRDAADKLFLNKTDDEIDNKYLQKNIVTAKMALMIAVCELFGWDHFAFTRTVGSCLGLAAIEDFWTRPAARMSKL